MMHHAQIAQRAFNTPLMVDPAKALAFLSGLGPRITGRRSRSLALNCPPVMLNTPRSPPGPRCSAMISPSAISAMEASPSP